LHPDSLSSPKYSEHRQRLVFSLEFMLIKFQTARQMQDINSTIKNMIVMD